MFSHSCDGWSWTLYPDKFKEETMKTWGRDQLENEETEGLNVSNPHRENKMTTVDTAEDSKGVVDAEGTSLHTR